MAGAFKRIKVPVSRIDLGHVGIFRALAEAAGLPQESEETVLNLLQAKDVPGLIEACAEVSSPYRELTRPVFNFLDEIDQERDDDIITVVIPESVTKVQSQWLHNQSALALKARLLYRPHTVVVSVPVHVD